MMRFAVNRIFWFVPTILAMAAFTFLIMHATPGSPFDVSDKQRPEDIKRLEALYGLDKPLPEQFVLYLGTPPILTSASPTTLDPRP